MPTLFILGLVGLAGFEVVSVSFIMPLPGSQRHETLTLAWGLFTARWVVRGVLGLSTLAGVRRAWARWRGLTAVGLVATVAVVATVNLVLSADAMFHPPKVVAFEPRASNRVDESAVVMVRAGRTPLRFVGCRAR